MAQDMPIYLDCNATSPIEPAVKKVLQHWFENECGNAGSRTHIFGVNAKNAVQDARSQIAKVVNAKEDEVVFTSGATESNNLAILGLAKYGESVGKKHIVSTAIEHKAVLEPLEYLSENGFSVTFIKPGSSGQIEAETVINSIQADSLLVSVMHVNNETGIRQPIGQIADLLESQEVFFHVDAAQGFGKELDELCNPRIDLISISSHKIYGPVGIGALITRKRKFKKLPIDSLVKGGGQEKGLRPGTLPVPLIVALGKAAELAFTDSYKRSVICKKIRDEALAALDKIGISINGAQEIMLPHVLNFSVDGIDSEALMLATKDLVAISNGSACTSQSYESSHVLTAMGLTDERVAGAVRISWCHLTPIVDWEEFVTRIISLR